ncbi:hypothetical protein EsDP_00001596 [Epichloe bromicola]|uniref:Uncharacterized protein n=1 Tax=Epichloe bromicola TaxID=79588 RepID=A0ABQ0CIB0_9HYPO
MSGGLDNQSDGHSMTSAPLLAAEHGASDDNNLGFNSSNNEHSAISSLKTTAPTNSDDVFSPGVRGTERRDYLEARYNHQRPPYAAEYIMTNGDKLVNNPVPPARSPLRPATQKSYETKSMNNASCWRKPVDWSAKNLTCPPYQPTETTSGHESTSSEELAKEVELMARAPPALALTKLKEPYKVGMSLEDQRRLDIEKERWMLSALQHLDWNWQQLSRETAMKAPETESTEPPKQKLLAFYEPQFSARYLAAFWRNKAVHHLSDRPLSFKASPNLHAIFKPSICTPFSELKAFFDTVYSMLLPALCPEPEILTILRNINMCLKSRGSLNLIIIDPIPNINALGEKMRTWFVKNLLRNLQQKSRCLNPSGTLPNLLSQASLRGPGSIVTTTQFYANPRNIGRHDREFELGDDLATKSARDDREVRAELRSIAGRMLWKEVWGQFVTSNTWWWEDADCMKECLELGTFWEYHSIQAVKSN